MFSGIVQQLGVVAAVERCDFGQTLRVDANGWAQEPAPGDSVAVNGCCLTVREPSHRSLEFDVIRQTLRVTTLGGLEVGESVNLETAVTPATMLGGHLVQGHVDGVGVVRRAETGPAERRLRIEMPPELRGFIVEKGSIAVDGVSLTVAALGDAWFEVALIPVTIERTSLGRAAVGRRVNLETDYIVKAVVNWLTWRERA